MARLPSPGRRAKSGAYSCGGYRWAALPLGALLLYVLLPRFLGSGGRAVPLDHAVTKAFFEDEKAFPAPKQEEVLKHKVMWQLPASKAKAVSVFFHGCSHAGSDLWEKSKDCPDCLGLPEEVRLRLTVLRRGHALVAITSRDRVSGCWDLGYNPLASQDGRVPEIIKTIMTQEGLTGLPIYAVGASSGGGFVQLLPHLMTVQGIVTEIFAVPVRLLQLEVAKGRFPPTYFIHMPRDEATAAKAKEDVAYLRGAGTAVIEAKVGPRPVTAALLQRSRHVSAVAAEAIAARLAQRGFLDGDGMLKADPREGGVKALKEVLEPVAGGLSLEPDTSHVLELLNLAWAGHELAADPINDALAWLEAGGKPSA